MREPGYPPRLEDGTLVPQMSKASRPEVQAYVTEANLEYYHWDKLRFRPRPAGLSLKSMGVGASVSHFAAESTAPHGRTRPSFWVRIAAGSLEVLHEVDRSGRSTMAVDSLLASAMGPMRDRVIVGSLMEEAIATSRSKGR